MEFYRENNTLKVNLAGDFDEALANRLREHLNRYMEKEGVNRIYFNMQQVPFIDSSGLGLLLGCYKKLAPRGGVVKVTNIAPALARIFTVAGLDHIIDLSIEN